MDKRKGHALTPNRTQYSTNPLSAGIGQQSNDAVQSFSYFTFEGLRYHVLNLVSCFNLWAFGAFM